MKWLSKLLKKKKPKRFETESELYAYMGSLGVSADAVERYQVAKDKIKAFENRR